eukprot:791500-Pelagomonas_calceolata.AAC.8
MDHLGGHAFGCTPWAPMMTGGLSSTLRGGGAPQSQHERQVAVPHSLNMNVRCALCAAMMPGGLPPTLRSGCAPQSQHEHQVRPMCQNDD